MDRERLSGGCLLALSLTALMLCSRLHGAEGQPGESNIGGGEETSAAAIVAWVGLGRSLGGGGGGVRETI